MKDVKMRSILEEEFGSPSTAYFSVRLARMLSTTKCKDVFSNNVLVLQESIMKLLMQLTDSGQDAEAAQVEPHHGAVGTLVLLPA